jgi:hypothetical protein
MRPVCRLALLLAVACCLWATGLRAGEPPFAVGEKLEYELKWEFIPAGRASLEVLPDRRDERRGYRFLLRVRSNSFVDLFYKVRERIESFTGADVERSLLYRERSRGSERKDVVVRFDWKRGTAQYADFGKKRDPIEIAPGTFDPLASFYAFRLHDLEGKSSIAFPVTDGKKHFTAKVLIKGKRRIEVGDRSYLAYLIEPEVNYFGGVFAKSEDPSVRLWLTADEQRIPVRIEVKVVVGSIVAELIEARFGRES